jgi:CHAT domain
VRSLLIEFHRFGKLNTGLLRQDDRYLVAAASHPICEVTMPLGYEEFLVLTMPLRYKEPAPARAAALQQVGDIVTTLLRSKDLDDLETGGFPLQLDLVVNAAELAALPFEAALGRNGEPLVVRSQDPVILTRRVRNDFVETLECWPAKARILFAWACPEEVGVPVPYQEHEIALRQALSSWIPLDGPSGPSPDVSSVLQVLAKASLDSIREACQEAVEQKKPFTHVHLLGHGYPVGESPKQMFGLALHAARGSDDLYAATPEEIAKALAPLQGQTGVLTLAACDSANATNMVIPRRSIAHELHVCGFPVVIGSQFPLTVPGSTILVECFYGELLAGKDVRDALHEARRALFEHSDVAGHDWASLIGYVRLPEGYTDHLPAVRLEAVLTSLKAVQSWSDDLIQSEVIDPARFDRLAGLLRKGLERLEAFVAQPGKLPRGVLEENLGLLGSAEKRLAELYFECGARSGREGWVKLMREALERARSWYRQGFDGNLSHHWTGVQCLSLEVVLAGKFSEPGRWYAAVLAAELDAAKPKEVWAWGSLAELYLIASAAGLGDQTDKAQRAILEMKLRIANSASGDRFPLESTERQFRRYIGWWTSANGFFSGQPDLSSRAALLADVLQAS